MLALGRERVVERGRDQHFDDRLAAPAELARIVIGAVHVGKRRRENNAGGVMIGQLTAGQGREARQFG